MKFVISTLIIALSVISQAQVLNYCRTSVDNPNAEFCARMGHLRATINVFDQQREMNLANYQYLGILGESLKNNSNLLVKAAPPELSNHKQALQNLAQMGQQISDLSKAKDASVFAVANNAGSVCLSCHTSSSPTPGGNSWNEVFKVDWRRITQDCSQPGRNPYLCKSMNGMLTSYNHLTTAYKADIRDFTVTAGVAGEVVRILKDLKTNNFVHMSENFRSAAQTSAEEVITLAQTENPNAFVKAVQLTTSCTQCHVSGTSAIRPAFKVF